MPKITPRLKNALTRERRKNRRLRALISQIQQDVQKHSHDLELQFERMAQIQANLDLIARKLSEGPPLQK